MGAATLAVGHVAAEALTITIEGGPSDAGSALVVQVAAAAVTNVAGPTFRTVLGGLLPHRTGTAYVVGGAAEAVGDSTEEAG